MNEDIVRVLRIIEYVGPRSRVEETVRNSIHGTKSFPMRAANHGMEIRVATIGSFPEILGQSRQPQPEDGLLEDMIELAEAHILAAEGGEIPSIDPVKLLEDLKRREERRR